MKNQFIDWLQTQDDHTKKIGKVYIDECLHQEGEEYFTTEFDTLDEIIDDFKLYMNNMEDE